MQFLVIMGNHTSTKSPVEYVDHIIYGDPSYLQAVEVGSHFVALVTYSDEQKALAEHTRDRMGSFPHGVKLVENHDEALLEFGRWVAHWAPIKKQPMPAGLPDWMRA